MFSLKTNNLGAYLVRLSGYGTYVTRTVTENKQSNMNKIYCKSSKVIDLGANRRHICNLLLVII